MRVRRDVPIAVAVGLACAATRFAHRGRGLFSWDSGLLSYGVLSFDFEAGRPHPPYYPLAIALAKLLHLVPGTTAAEALVALSILSSGVLAGLTYLLGRGWLGVPAALLATALVVLSPTALFNGAAALTYAAEGAASAAVAWAAWRCRAGGRPRDAAVLAAVASAAVGIRPSSLFLLLPLGLWAVWGRWRLVGWAAGAGAAATAAWVVPMLVAGGGWQAFLAGNRYQSRHVVFAHTVAQDGWSVVPENLGWLGRYVEGELPFLAALTLLAAVTAFGWARHVPARVGSLLACWIGWPVLFFALVYAGWPVYPSGYVLVLVPGVALAAATVAQALAVAVRRSDAPAAVRGAVAVALAAVLCVPATWASSWPEATGGLREADAWNESWWALERDYPPETTALVTFYGWFWARLDHPEYLTWGTLPLWNSTGAVHVHLVEGHGDREDRSIYAGAVAGDGGLPRHPIPDWVEHVVLVYAPPTRDDPYSFKPGLPVANVTLASGMRVSVLDPEGLRYIEQAIVWFDDEGRPLA